MEKMYDLGAIVEPLCLWYEENKRSMPWRDDATPYHVWISEIMLQQTRIEAVKAYYRRFMERLPDIDALADIPEEELLKLWEGLGYYNRARNLKKAAIEVRECYGGELPADYDLLLTLPGIGSYTAGAIASIAYQIPAPAVDGNVLRVTMRILNCKDDISAMSVRKRMEKSIREVIPSDKPGDFNQAIMELGETICIPNGMPLCEKCPLRNVCMGHREGTAPTLPVKAEKKARKKEKRTVFVWEYKDCVAIRKRSEKGLLAGLWEFPSVEGHQTLVQVEQWLKETQCPMKNVKRLKPGTHIFSHVEWHMKGYRIEVTAPEIAELFPDVIWVDKEELKTTYSIPVAFRPFTQQVVV